MTHLGASVVWAEQRCAVPTREIFALVAVGGDSDGGGGRGVKDAGVSLSTDGTRGGVAEVGLRPVSPALYSSPAAETIRLEIPNGLSLERD